MRKSYDVTLVTCSTLYTKRTLCLRPILGLLCGAIAPCRDCADSGSGGRKQILGVQGMGLRGRSYVEYGTDR